MKTLLPLVVAASLLFSGCAHTDLVEPLPTTGITRSNAADEAAGNPYLIEIMQQAVDQVTDGLQTRSLPHLEPTSYYVAFTPTTKEQYDAVRENYSTLNFSIDNPPKDNGKSYTEIYSYADKLDTLYAFVPNVSIMPDSIRWNILHAYYDPQATELGKTNPELAEEIVATAFTIVNTNKIDKKPIGWKPTGQNSSLG